MNASAPVDGRDPTRVVTRRCIALLIDALLLALLPAATVALGRERDHAEGRLPRSAARGP